VLVEEGHEALRANRCPASAKAVAKRGRHYGSRGVGLWTSSQRIYDVDPDLRAELNASESVYFRLSEGSDLDVIRRRKPGLEKVVAELPRLHCVRIVPGRPVELFRVEPDTLAPTVHFVRAVNL
jgi:hypothetical protein